MSTNQDTKKSAKFQSRWGFILAAVGSAVGMANVWGFHAKLGSNGGGAFLIAYLVFIVLFGVVGLSAEYAIGRKAAPAPWAPIRWPGKAGTRSWAKQADFWAGCLWPAPCVSPSATPLSFRTY